jgi:outer membrane biosynthesis protein TonB
MVIDADGNITHLRFTRLSSLDSVNKQAFESVKKWHYEPTVLNGERVSVCSTVDVTVDF